MKFFKFISLWSTFVLASQSLLAIPNPASFDDQENGVTPKENVQDLSSYWKKGNKGNAWNNNSSSNWNCQKSKPCPLPLCCHLGRSVFDSFFPGSTPINVETPLTPDYILLSKEGNLGHSQGNVKVTKTGLTLKEDGNYLVIINLIGENREVQNPEVINLAMFLAINGVVNFERDNPNIVSNVGSFVKNVNPFPLYFNLSQTGTIVNAKKGDQLSIVVSNLPNAVIGIPPIQPQVLTVYGWSIEAIKLPCYPSTTTVEENGDN